jgi:diadenosine tetraphosphatase ApaH/serine/threonine PP2A family protein phosphatase
VARLTQARHALILAPTRPEQERTARRVSDRRRVFGHYHLTFERTSALGIELVGPGSVGIPMDGDHRAAYALLHDDAASAARVRETAAGASWGETIAPRIEQATA